MESNFEWITANGDIGIRFFHSIDDGGYSNPPHWHNDLEIITIIFTLLWMKGRPVRRKNKNSQNSKQFSGRWTRCTVRRKKGIS